MSLRKNLQLHSGKTACSEILGYNLTEEEDSKIIQEKNLLFTVCPKLCSRCNSDSGRIIGIKTKSSYKINETVFLIIIDNIVLENYLTMQLAFVTLIYRSRIEY